MSNYSDEKRKYFLRCCEFLQLSKIPPDDKIDETITEARNKHKYFMRCCKFLGLTEIPPDNEVDKTIKEAHKKHNEDLLSGQTFDGCHRCVECYCDEEECHWEYGAHRCSCDNYKGFYWDTDGVDWLRDINLDSTRYVGEQGRMW